MDDRLVAYVGTRWTDLVDYARDLCAGSDDTDEADDEEAQELVLSTLTAIAGRWWFVRERDEPDGYVRRKVQLACGRCARRRTQPGDFQLMAPVATGGAERYTASEALAVLEHRTGRVRRMRQTAACIAALALAVVGAVGLASNASSPRASAHQVLAVPSRAFPQGPAAFAAGVTAGGGDIWTIESRAASRGRSFVVQRDPASGRVEARYAVPEQDDHIAFGLGKVWVWHDSTDFPSTAIATVDPLGDVESSRSRPPIAVKDATFTLDSAWFTEPAVNSIVRFTRGVFGGSVRVRSAGASFVVPASPSSVLVAGRNGTLRELPVDRIVGSVARPTLVAPAPSYGIWIGHGRSVAYQSSAQAAATTTLTLPLRVGAVVGDPADGVYVATRSENPLHYDPYLVYYSPAALRASNPQPTARLDGHLQAEDMAADPAGGIVFVTNEGTVDAWDPAT